MSDASSEPPHEAEGAVDGEDAEALKELAIQAIDREEFEANVIGKVDKALEKDERERRINICLKELKDVLAALRTNKSKLLECERQVKRLHNSSSTLNRAQHRLAASLLDDQEKCRAAEDDLVAKQTSLVADLEHLQYDLQGDKEIKLYHRKHREEDGNGTADKKAESEGVFAVAEAAETEQEKSIRLGEMTAFGKTLKTNTDRDGAAKYAEYLKDIKALSGDTGERRVTQRPQKRTLPEVSQKEFDNGTDDSDWESSDDERKVKKRKRSSTAIVDDGDREEYLDRLDAWQEQAGEAAKDSAYEKLEGGLLVPSRIWEKLYNYQKVCVLWLWELHQQRVGGILGDEMGLGKTIQIVSFLASMSFSRKHLSGGKFGPVLIVCPTTVMHQWVKEFHKWWPLFRVAILHESGSFKGSRTNLIRSIAASKGILITSFNGVVAFKEQLVNEDFQYVILDEGHKIRNPDAQVTLSVKMFPTAHRLILSGSPLQNNLKELWSLFDFIYPGKLGTLPVFMQQFSVPITMGGYANASRVQVATAYKCATVLRDTINPYLLRRMKSDVKQHINLPEKNEQVLFCRLTEEQREVYKTYIESGEIKSILDGRMQVFVGLINLRKICNHPDLYDGGPRHYAGRREDDEREEDEEFGYWKRSGKMIVIESLLKLWKKQGHRVLLFTQSRQMLTVLERFVQDREYSYMKLDGSTAIGSRQSLIEKFNSTQDIFVFLLTTKVGGLGVNLTGANRVVIFDPDWNPSTDTQARERAWRIGQDKQVTIYRLMTAGTIEEKIYHRQIFKQFLVNRVLKDPKQKRFFKSNDLYELFTLNEGTSDRTETSAIFAGTGSDVKVRKRSKKSGREKDREMSLHAGASAVKPSKVLKPEQRTKSSVDSALKNIYEDQTSDRDERKKKKTESDEELSEERRRLMEKVRAISRKLSKSKETRSYENEDNKPGPSSRISKDNRHKKKRRSRDGKLDGERVPGLVRSGTYKSAKSEDGEKDTESWKDEGRAAEQDNYVLAKLFKRSGVHSAVQHDVIVDGGGDDYILVEGEAERVAKEAVKSLKESRRQCFRAEAGVPTWTGSHGHVAKKPRFGKRKPGREGDSEGAMFSGKSGKSDKMMTSSDLLKKMKERNRFIPKPSREEDELFQSGSRSNQEDVTSKENVELLTEIRNFLAFQSSVDGQASTYELVERFKQRLPPQKNPLFKALLNEICSFSRDNDGRGIWRLKSDFC